MNWWPLSAFGCLLKAFQCFLVGAKMWHKCNICHIYASFNFRMFPPGETFLQTKKWHKTDKTDSFVTFMSHFVNGLCQFWNTFMFRVRFMLHLMAFLSLLCDILDFWQLIIFLLSFNDLLSHLCHINVNFCHIYVTFLKFGDLHWHWVPEFLLLLSTATI